MFKLAFVLLSLALVGSDACATVTKVQGDLIRQSWDIAKRDGDLAPKAFIRLFRDHPEYQKLFSKFADVPLDQLRSNGDFLAQAYTVAAGLNRVVESTGDLLATELAQLGVAHVARGAKPWHFDAFARALVATLKDELGENLSPQAEDAWIDALTIANKVISSNLRPAGDVVDVQTKLTPNQVKAVQGVWAKVRGDRQKIGEETLLRLFQHNPSYQSLFPRFASAANVAGDAEFKKQAAAVVERLDDLVTSLDNDLVLVGQLIYLGHTHFPRRVNREHFSKFTDELVQVLGSRGASADEQATLRAVVNTLVGQIIDNLH